MSRTRFNKLICLAVFLFVTQLTWAADALNFFNNWFVTGDYAVAGVGLRGTGQNGWVTGNINMSGVPSNATPIAAFLYWSTVETSTTPNGANGYFNNNAIQGQVLGNPQSPNASPCTGNGASAVASFGYRADVLRFLPVNSNNVFQANGTQTVKLPASTANVIYTDGATLVVIYKVVVSGFPLIAPLRAVVIYDGAFTLTNKSAAMTQNLPAIFQASTNPGLKVTGVVANGQRGFSSPWSVNNSNLSTDPFVAAQGANWDNPTYNANLAPLATSFSTMATASGTACLTWAAIIASVNVQDTDNDGLLDIWETSGLYVNTAASPAVFGTCVEYGYTEPNCVPLNLMGAKPNKQDLFIQMDWMYADGTVNGNPAHNHIPPLSSLSQVAATFALHQINVHFDVGNNYQGAQTGYCTGQCSFIIPETYAAARPAPDTASGINEATLLCPQNTTCTYGDLPYPVLDFEFGFDSVRDGNYAVGISAHLPQQRIWAFRYALFAHAIGGPYSANGTPISPAPQSFSGIAQLPGSGFMVTFGLWPSDNPAYNMVGTPFQVANTIHHELGHTLGLYHGGLSANNPNCMPNYPSAMNYLYQIRGLEDGNGNDQVDYSYGLLLPLSENLLNTNIPMALPGIQHYKVRFYGPLAGPLAPPGSPNQPSQAATVHCDGSATTETLVKLEGATVSTPDWSDGNVPLGKFIPQIDLNNEGTSNQIFLDQPDWFVLNLQQVGSAPDFSGISVGAKSSQPGVPPYDAGGKSSQAGGKSSQAGAKFSDVGSFQDTGVSYSASAGNVASDAGGKSSQAGEVYQGLVILSGGLSAPTSVTATSTATANVVTFVPPDIGGNLRYNIYRCLDPGTGCNPTTLLTPTPITPGGPGTGTPSAPMYSDTVTNFGNTGPYYGGTACPAGDTCPNTNYIYAVQAVATVCSTAPGECPTPVTTGTCPPGDTCIEQPGLVSSPSKDAEVTEAFVVADNNPDYSNDNLVTYNATPQHAAYHVFGVVVGTLNSADITCTTATPAGSYPASCNGAIVNPPYNQVSPTDLIVYVPSGATYTDAAGIHKGGTLIIQTRNVTVATFTAANKSYYDGTTTEPNGNMTCTLSNAVQSDVQGGLVTCNPIGGTFNSSQVLAANKVSATAGLGSTAAANYTFGAVGSTVNSTSVSATPVSIIPEPVTVTANNQQKTYGQTPAFGAGSNQFVATGLVNPDTIGSVTLAASNNGGAATAPVGTYTITPSAATGGTFVASNYAITYATGTLTVDTLVLTATLTSAPSKTYDGTTSETNSMTCSVATVISPDVVSCTATNGNFNTSQVATANLVTATATISGAAVSNYTLGAGGTTVSVTSTSVTAASSITTRPVTAIFTAQSKPYDGTQTESSGNMSCSLTNAVPADVTSNNVTCIPSNGLFNSSQVVGATTVNATATLSGSAAADYTFGANGTAVNSIGVRANPVSIAQAPLIITASSASIAYGSPVLITAMFNAFVNNETVSVLGAGFGCGTTYVPGNPTGNAGNNYATLCSGAVDTNYNISYVGGMVMVSPAQLTVTATGVNKSFDGTTNAPVTLTDNRLTGSAFAADTFTDAYTSASFASIGPGTGIAVNVAGISISGSGATNYTLASTTAAAAANISDSINLSALSLNGVNYGLNIQALPTWSGNMLTLTNNSTETASAWLPTAIPVTSAFTTTFQFQITPATSGPNSIGDGFAFVIQGAPSGNTTLGTTGEGEYIGYFGIPNSIAIEFDTYYNSDFGDPAPAGTSDAHVGIQSLGAMPNTSDHDTPNASLGTPTLFNFADGAQHTATITYDGQYTFNVYVDGSLVVTGTLTSPLGTFLGLNGGTAYIGFTGATGAAQETDILGSTWTWDYSLLTP